MKTFTKQSKKRYEAVREAVINLPAPEGYVIIPGRQRRSEGVSDRVYVEVRYTKVDYGRRYYFDKKPTSQETHQVVRLLLEVMEAKRCGYSFYMP